MALAQGTARSVNVVLLPLHGVKQASRTYRKSSVGGHPELQRPGMTYEASMVVSLVPGIPNAPYGHTMREERLSIEMRRCCSLPREGTRDDGLHKFDVAAGIMISELIAFDLFPRHEIFLVLRTSRDISRGHYDGGNINTEATFGDGDEIAFLGPVPQSLRLWRAYRVIGADQSA